jgi:TetR/AcrR family transcriptional repressor of bet genes
MPKIVDHDARRDEIAHVACRVVASHGFEQATVVKIAREAGYTTGMVAHYFDSKQEIILAALRLILRRIEERLARPAAASAGLLDLLAEALPLDGQRSTECAFWAAFWGQVPADRRLKRINAWVHREYQRLFERCFAARWPEWATWPVELRADVLGAVTTFINGLTASVITSATEWPPERQLAQLGLQLELWRSWATARAAGSAAKPDDPARAREIRAPAT